MMTTNFEVREKMEDDIKIITVQGELDALVAPQLKEKIAKQLEIGTPKIIINFEELVHINSLAMGILRGQLRIAKEQGGDIKLVRLSEHISTIFEMIGLDELFEIYATEEEAVAKFK